MFEPFMRQLLLGVLTAWLLSACWCGSDGPPRPPKAMPEHGDVKNEALTPGPKNLP